MATLEKSRTTSNPVLSRQDIFTREGYVGFHDAPTAAAAGQAQPQTQPGGLPEGPGTYAGPTMTINDVVVKTFILFVVGAVGVAIAWALDFPVGLTFGAMIVGLVLAFVNIFKKKVSPPLIMAYALVQGVFLACISAWYQDYANAGSAPGEGSNIVLQAIIGTATAFVVMLVLYTSGKLRATAKFKKIMLASLISYGLIAVASFIGALFGVGEGWGFYGVGGLGLLLCVAGVALASFTLILDFDAIQSGVELGVPEQESWRASFGLLVTLIWLYLEILRFLAILQGRD